MANAEPHRVRWTLGLLTVASTCLLPISSEETADESVEIGVPTRTTDATPATDGPNPGDRLVTEETSENTDVTPASGDAGCRFTRRADSSPHPIPARTSQLLASPGPPIYRISPCHSPPARCASATS